MPVYMFDKEGNFHVLTVEQVSLPFLFYHTAAAAISCCMGQLLANG
jgi:hypothetical protein